MKLRKPEWLLAYFLAAAFLVVAFFVVAAFLVLSADLGAEDLTTRPVAVLVTSTGAFFSTAGACTMLAIAQRQRVLSSTYGFGGGLLAGVSLSCRCLLGGGLGGLGSLRGLGGGGLLRRRSLLRGGGLGGLLGSGSVLLLGLGSGGLLGGLSSGRLSTSLGLCELYGARRS